MIQPDLNNMLTKVCQITPSTSALLIFALTVFQAHRALAVGQLDCPFDAAAGSICNCTLDNGDYVIRCHAAVKGVKLLQKYIPAVRPRSSNDAMQIEFVYRSMTFDTTSISLKIVQAKAFDGLRIIELRLDRLDIMLVDRLAFVGIGDELVLLVLDHNSIESLEVGTFDPLSSAETISLADNKLSVLELGTFGAELTSLRWLYLSDNILNSIPDTVLSNLTSLRGLWLDGNKISRITSGMLRGLTSLLWLDLSDNNIETTSFEAFSELRSLERLWLQGNNMIKIDSGGLTPSAFQELELWDLSDNLLTTVELEHLHSSSSRFLYLGLLQNEWTCDCTIVNSLRRLSQVSGVSNATCSYPFEIMGKTIVCQYPANCTMASLPSYCPDPITTTTVGNTMTVRNTMTTTVGNTTTVSGAADKSANHVGLIVGVVVGVSCFLIILIVIVVCCYVNRKPAAKNPTQFQGTYEDIGDDNASLTNLTFRLGGAHQQSTTNPYFDLNTRNIQAQAAENEGVGSGYAANAASDPEAEDVAVTAKPGYKKYINTNVVSQNFAKIGTEC